MMLLTFLLASIAWAQPIVFDCAEQTIAIPVQHYDFKLPRGFAWEGLTPIAKLRDGRLVLARSASFEGLSRKALASQRIIESPARLIEVVVVHEDGTLDRAGHLPRGTIFEVATMSDGTVVLAHRERELTRLWVMESERGPARAIDLPSPLDRDDTWRDQSPVRGKGPPRLHPLGPTRLLYAYGSDMIAIDLATGRVIQRSFIWSTQFATMFPLAGGAQIVGMETEDRLVRLDASLHRVEETRCRGCRVSAIGVGADRKADFAVLVRPTENGLGVSFLDPDLALTETATAFSLPIPEDLLASAWAWSLEPGLEGTALLAVSGMGDRRFAQVWALSPSERRFVWSWSSTAGGFPGWYLVADAVLDHVRLRFVTGDGGRRVTHEVAVADVHTGNYADWKNRPSTTPSWLPLLFDDSSPSQQGPHTGILVDGEPMFDRVPPGPASQTLSRCRLKVPAP